MNIFCKIGIHRPLKNHEHLFNDVGSGHSIFKATCSCGKEWLVDSPLGWFGDKILRSTPNKILKLSEEHMDAQYNHESL